MVTYILIAISVAAAILFMVSIALKVKPAILLILKTSASLLFVGVGISAYFYSGGASVVQFVSLLMGLCFGVLGDSLLACKNMFGKKQDLFILMGIGAFALGHMMYIVLFSTMYRMSFIEPIVALGLAAWVVMLTKTMKFNYRKLFIPVTLYCFIILLMMICSVVNMFVSAFAPVSIILAVGSALFVISDLILAMIYFGPKKIRGLGAVNLSAYYCAQILIAFSLMFL